MTGTKRKLPLTIFTLRNAPAKTHISWNNIVWIFCKVVHVPLGISLSKFFQTMLLPLFLLIRSSSLANVGGIGNPQSISDNHVGPPFNLFSLYILYYRPQNYRYYNFKSYAQCVEQKSSPIRLLFRSSYCKDAAIFVRFSSIRSKYVLLSSLLSIV